MRFGNCAAPIAALAALSLACRSLAGDPPAGPRPGQPAPPFELKDQAGKLVKLAELEGKVVVLEWTNPECPFVKRHLRAGTMKQLAGRYRGQGVVWLAVDSSGHHDQAHAARLVADEGLPYRLLVDQDGRVGKLYGARTTPHMFVIDKDGKLAYAGAIDNDKDGKGGPEVVNHVGAALQALLAGKPVPTPETRPYGCSVKYKS